VRVRGSDEVGLGLAGVKTPALNSLFLVYFSKCDFKKFLIILLPEKS